MPSDRGTSEGCFRREISDGNGSDWQSESDFIVLRGRRVVDEEVREL